MTAVDAAFLEELQKDFLEEITFLLEDCESSYLKLENPQCRKEELGKIFRLAHSLKGAGQAVGYLDLAKFAHIVEDLLSILRLHPDAIDSEIISLLLLCGDNFKNRIKMLKAKDPANWDVSATIAQVDATIRKLANTTTAAEASEKTVEKVSKEASHTASGSIRIDASRIENVLDIVGELVVIKSQIMNKSEQYSGDKRLLSIASQLDKTVRELQDKTLSMRLTPLKNLFLKTQRVIRDLSVKLGKPIEFHMKGEETEIDRTMVDLLGDPLIHIARNSLDHGIENKDRRSRNKKSETGNIHLGAQQIGDRVVIQISDDGGGIDRAKVIKKALEKGLLSPNQDLSGIADSQIFQLIFEPGFSTAEIVTDISGRGVGMDIVKNNVEKMKGTIEISSVEGKGTTISLSLPVTTSITDGMITQIGSQQCILPMDCIIELIKTNQEKFVVIENGTMTLNHREKMYPVLDLANVFSDSADKHDVRQKMLVLIQAGLRQFAIAVDSVLGQTQVVLKVLNDSFKEVKGVSGAAILGDGKVALVINPHGLRNYIQETNETKSQLMETAS